MTGNLRRWCCHVGGSTFRGSLLFNNLTAHDDKMTNSAPGVPGGCGNSVRRSWALTLPMCLQSVLNQILTAKASNKAFSCTRCSWRMPGLTGRSWAPTSRTWTTSPGSATRTPLPAAARSAARSPSCLRTKTGPRRVRQLRCSPLDFCQWCIVNLILSKQKM